MKRIALMTDSNSGLTQKKGKELGISVLPSPFIIDGQVLYEDIDLTQEEFYEKLESDVEVSTSQPSPEEVMKVWDELLQDAETVLYIPLSSGLSGACQTAAMLAHDYEGRVQVVNNQRISVTQRHSLEDAMHMIEQGMEAVQIKEVLEKERFESTIYIMLDTLSYLKKGGRITPAAAALGTALRLKPVLQIQGEKLDKFTTARTKKQGIAKMINAIREDLDQRFGGDVANVRMAVAYTKDREPAEQFAKQVEEELGCKVEHIDPLSLTVSCHIGPGALAVACSKIL